MPTFPSQGSGNLVTGAFIASLMFSPMSSFAQDSWSESDKQSHAIFSGVIGGMTARAYPDSPLTAWGVAMVPGVAKELIDPRISKKDLFADALGATIGVMLYKSIVINSSEGLHKAIYTREF